MERIFVSVGTHPQAFNRLLEEMDRLLESRVLKASVFAQTGCSTYKPKNYEYKELLQDKDYVNAFKEADIVISHGGAGTIINALRLGKKLIVAPRLEKFNEHTNDHQLDLAKALEKGGKCLAVYEMRELGAKIGEARKFKGNQDSNRAGLVARLKEFIEH